MRYGLTDEQRAALLRKIVGGTVLLLLVTDVAAAQTANPFCEGGGLNPLLPVVQGAIRLSIGLGLTGAILGFFGTSAMESLPVGAERREAAKQFSQRARTAALKLLFGGAGITIILSSVYEVGCLNLIPF